MLSSLGVEIPKYESCYCMHIWHMASNKKKCQMGNGDTGRRGWGINATAEYTFINRVLHPRTILIQFKLNAVNG